MQTAIATAAAAGVLPLQLLCSPWLLARLNVYAFVGLVVVSRLHIRLPCRLLTDGAPNACFQAAGLSHTQSSVNQSTSVEKR